MPIEPLIEPLNDASIEPLDDASGGEGSVDKGGAEESADADTYYVIIDMPLHKEWIVPLARCVCQYWVLINQYWVLINQYWVLINLRLSISTL
jgi:hypothetical protein